MSPSHKRGGVEAQQPCCVYGVIGSRRARTFESMGLGGERIGVVSHCGLSAIISPAAADGYPATRPNVVAHHLVLEEAMRIGAVLPMRFGVIAPSAQAVRDLLLKPRLALLRRLLARVTGKVELGLKAYWREQLVFKEIIDENQELRTLRDSLLGRPDRETKSERIRLGRMVEADLRSKQEREAGAILAALRPLAHDAQIGRIDAEMMVLNAAFLVGAERQGEFDEAVEKLHGKIGQRLVFKYVGPLPPYSFVNISLEVKR